MAVGNAVQASTRFPHSVRHPGKKYLAQKYCQSIFSENEKYIANSPLNKTNSPGIMKQFTNALPKDGELTKAKF